MENKRLLLATVLSLAVLVIYSYFFAPQTPPAPEQAPAPAQQAAPRPIQPGDTTPGAAFTPGEGRTVSVTTPLYTARFFAQGGVLQNFILERYKTDIEPSAANIDLVSRQALEKAPLGLIWNGAPTWSRGEWSLQGSDLNIEGEESGQISFVCDIAGVRLIRTLTFHADNYFVEETVRIENPSTAQVAGRLAFTLASTSLSAEDDRYNPTRVEYLTADQSLESEADIEDLAKTGLTYSGQVNWGGLTSNYFLLAITPVSQPATFKALFTEGLYRIAVEKSDILLDPGAETTVSAGYFMGPKVRERLAAAPAELSRAIDYGWFDAIAKPLMLVLDWLYSFTRNWGVAIILLTVLIKIVFWPLSQKSYKSMNQMKKLQPMMAKIREKHADDRARMNQEMMQLYRTYKVNPMGGCLPMLLQIPVFLGLYNALMGAIELRHASFIEYLPLTDHIWLADLSAKDPYYITPLIMGATMFLQQKLTPAAGDPTQQKIMMLMPVVFTFLFLNFPAGLVLYWLTNNVLSIAQQWWLMRKA